MRMLFIFLALTVTTGLFGQSSPVLMTIGDEKVTLAEFERIYQKNNGVASLNRQTPEEYLELFINFKLKVKEAETLGMDTTAQFINELEGYRKQLAKPYLEDEADKEKMMKEAYEWSKYDIRASHILIRLPENPSPEDTLAAYEKIMEIRDRIMRVYALAAAVVAGVFISQPEPWPAPGRSVTNSTSARMPTPSLRALRRRIRGH